MPGAGGERPRPKLKRRLSTEISLCGFVGQPANYREADRKNEDAEHNHREYGRGQASVQRLQELLQQIFHRYLGGQRRYEGQRQGREQPY